MKGLDRAGALVVAELSDGELAPVSLDAAAWGLKLAQEIGRDPVGAVLGRSARRQADEFSRRSGMRVVLAEHRDLAFYNAEAYISVLAGIARELAPDYVVVPHTATGWDFAPRLAVALSWSCSTAVTGLGTLEDGFYFERRVCSGRLISEVAPLGPGVITVMPGSIRPREPGGRGEVLEVEVEADCEGTQSLGREAAAMGAVDLSAAEVIVAAGRGAGSEEGVRLVTELAGCFDKGAVGASRGLVDAGWLGLEHQVGQTGQTVAPALYIACGISGAIQHTVAMSGSGLVVAVNTDPDAPIFQVAQIGVKEDLYKFLPLLIEKLSEGSGKGRA